MRPLYPSLLSCDIQNIRQTCAEVLDQHGNIKMTDKSVLVELGIDELLLDETKPHMTVAELSDLIEHDDLGVVFRRYDLDDSGSISVLGLKNIAEEDLGVILHHKEVKKLVGMFESEDDGLLSLSEFKELWGVALAKKGLSRKHINFGP